MLQLVGDPRSPARGPARPRRHGGLATRDASILPDGEGEDDEEGHSDEDAR